MPFPVFGGILALIFAILLGMLWRQDRQQAALREWSIACLLIAIGAPLRILPEQWPEWLRIAASNALMISAYSGFWIGARRFRGLQTPLLARFAGPALWLATLPWLLPHFQGRVMIISAIHTLYALLIAWEFARGARIDRLPSHGPLILLLLIYSSTTMTRLLLTAWFGIVPMTAQDMPRTGWNDMLAVAGLTCFAGMAMMLVAISREQAERRSVERLTRARDLADAANRNKSRFLARMSHELRTPLNAVYGMAQVLAQDAELNPRQREQARLLAEAGRHLLAIVNDALDLARVEAGRLDLAPQPVPLRETLRATLELAAPAAAAKQQELRFEAATTLPATVLLDPLRLRQIAMNLLGNATKFTPPGGRITLSAGWAEGKLRLCVEDNGPGLPAEVRAALFGEYVQGREESATGQGSGLGLAISAALAQAMNGRLHYEPGPRGLGSRFVLSLPAPEASHAPERPLRLLVVDEVSVNRQLTRAILETAGHAVAEAADGAAALAALQSGPLPDAVLMEVRMQQLDGLETTRRIRALGGAAARLPVIGLTAAAGPAEATACRTAGMDGHLARPIDRSALLAELARLTARKTNRESCGTLPA